MSVFHQLVEVLSPDFLLHRAVYGSIVVGAVCPLVGVYLILRRLVFWGVALPQVSTAGVSFAFLLETLGVSFLSGAETHERHLAILGSLVFTGLAILALAALERRGRGSPEGRIGALYATAAAASILFVAFNASGEAEILGMLRGEVVAISESDFHAMLNTFGVVAAVLLLFRREFVLLSFDRDMAVTLGRSVLTWDLLLYTVMALCISLGVMTVGPLVVFACLVIPPAAALPWAKGVLGASLLAAAFGGASALAGFTLAYVQDLPLGPVIVCANAAALLLSQGLRRLMLSRA